MGKIPTGPLITPKFNAKMPKRHSLQHPYLLLTLAPLIWGGNVVAGRLATGEIAPFTLTALRWFIALLWLLPFALPALKTDWSSIRTRWPLLLGYGAIGFAGFNLLLYLSLHYTTAVNVTLIQSAIPMFILALNRLLFKERLKSLQILGIFLAFFGVALVISGGQLNALLQLGVNKGDAMTLLAALLYAVYSLGLKYKPNISWLSFIFVGAFGAFLTSLPFVAYEAATQTQLIRWSGESVLLIIYVSLFASIVAQLAYAKGVSIIGASRAGIAINLVPIFGALLAVLLLKEHFYSYHLLALLLVLSGIALSEYAAGKKSRA